MTMHDGTEMPPPTSGTTPAAIPPVSPASHASVRPATPVAATVRPVQKSVSARTLFGAAAVQQPAPPSTSAPKLKSNDGHLHRTLIGVAPSEVAAAASRAAASRASAAHQVKTRGEVTNAPVLPIGTIEAEQTDGRQGAQRSTRPQIHHRAARERDEPKTMPAVPIEAHETPRNAREAVIRDSQTHGVPKVQPGLFSGRPSLPSLPPLRNSLPGRALSRVNNNTLFAVLAAAAVIVIGAEVLRRFPVDNSDEEALEAEMSGLQEPGVVAASGESPAAAPSGPMTRISTQPTGAEIVYRGAVIANTPADVQRPETEADYLLRKPGYQPQLVRISSASPSHITLNLQPSGAAAGSESSVSPTGDLGGQGLAAPSTVEGAATALSSAERPDPSPAANAAASAVPVTPQAAATVTAPVAAAPTPPTQVEEPPPSSDLAGAPEAATPVPIVTGQGPARGRSGLPILPPRRTPPPPSE